MAADLPQPQQRGEYGRVAAGVALFVFRKLGKPLLADLFVEIALGGFHLAVERKFGFRRQIGRHLRLGAAFDEGADPGGEVLLQGGVFAQVRIGAPESGQRAEHPRLQEIHDAPQVLG